MRLPSPRFAATGGRPAAARIAVLLSLALCAIALAPSPAGAAAEDPLFVVETPPPPPAPQEDFKGPCGVTVDSAGDFYLANYYERAVGIFRPPDPPFDEPPTELGQAVGSAAGPNQHQGPVDDPCGLALDSAGTLYLNNYHRNVYRFPDPLSLQTATEIDAGHPTGVAVDPATDRVYVDARTHIAVYEPSGDPVDEGAGPLWIGAGSLDDGYGIAVSGFPATAGRLYVPDAASDTVKVYDPAISTAHPVQTIGGFVSLKDSAAAVDNATGELYVVDAYASGHAPFGPRARVYVFSASGSPEGRLKHDVYHGEPTGLAVDNSGGPIQGRVYVTSGNTENGSLYAYPPSAATGTAKAPQDFLPSPSPPQLIPQVQLGGETPPDPSPEIACIGDSCQVLQAAPTDPTLTTALQGLGNPVVHYLDLFRRCRSIGHLARRLAHRSRRLEREADRADDAVLRRRASGLSERSARAARRARRCRSHPASASAAPRDRYQAQTPALEGGMGGPRAPTSGHSRAARSDALIPGAAGFAVSAEAHGGGSATLAGSHPYALRLALRLDQSGGARELRDLSLELPRGLLTNLNAPDFCPAAAFASPRSSPFETAVSGESCPDRSQVGTIAVEGGGGQVRSFGLFNLTPPDGTAARLGSSPYGTPLLFDTRITLDSASSYAQKLVLAGVPRSLGLHALEITLWGVPWDPSHNPQRGDCLNEAEPSFGWAKCTPGSLQAATPRAYLTMPTECRDSLSFRAEWSVWEGPGPLSAEALNRDAAGNQVPIGGCGFLSFEPVPDGFLNSNKAGSPSGFVFRLRSEVDRGLLDPAFRIDSHPRSVELELPEGVSLNAGLADGLAVCRPDQLARETAFNPFGSGCPTAAKIGEFRFRTPLYQGFLDGSAFLAQPDDKGTPAPGAENPFDTLLAVYLVAKSAERGLLIKLDGKIAVDPVSGNLTATFEGLPQFPYTDLEATFASGQRAPLVSPPLCGAAPTRTTVFPWSGGPTVASTTTSAIDQGADAGPCPDGATPPFNPTVIAGGVNANVGSYTPYFVHISRRDSEQQLTSYSLILPRGITGRLAGIPFCPEAAIEAARARGGFEEVAAPSCPSASRVGRTLTGYSVGAAVAYAPGSIYLAGPYNGRPLSLVTIDSATVGAFDLGTIVIRSAFSLDPRTAQLEIDSRASDPIPHIIDGFPLNLRDVRLHVDRPAFIRNPTGCAPSELVSTLTGSGARFGDRTDDPSTVVRTHYQLLNCLDLGFQPLLGLRLRGPSRRGAYPELQVTLRARDDDAGLKRIVVSMPPALFVAQNHLRSICTRDQFAAERCPPASVYGRATLFTPLFDQPLSGPVVLRSAPGPLPDIVASLRSGAVRIVVEGRIGRSGAGGIHVFFDDIPDAPIDRFVFHLDGGRRGLLVNATDVCAHPPAATVRALGQNNRGVTFSTELQGQCGPERGGARVGSG